jgi:cytoskeletal protein RodZ
MADFRAAISDLSASRARRGISLRDIAGRTKIRVFYLEAIEKGEFEKLPGGVYTRSYVRQYSQAIDIDADELLRALPPDDGADCAPASAPESTLWGLLARLASLASVPPARAGGTR